MIDWDQPKVVSRALVLQVSAEGRFEAVATQSWKPQPLTEQMLLVLVQFTRPATTRQAYQAFCERFEIEEADFGQVVEWLVTRGVLVSPGGGAQAEAETLPHHGRGYASVLTHHLMLRDAQRVLQYQKAIARQAPGRRVLELGCGTGVLSIFAARAGAASVTAIEETSIADLAERMFAANGCQVRLARGNSLDVVLPERADLIVHELIGDGPIDENMLAYVDDARRRFLAPGGRILPAALEVRCVGVELGDPERVLAEARSFEALYGLSFAPYQEALRELDRRGGALAKGDIPERPRVLTEELVLQRFEATVPLEEQRWQLQPRRLALRASAEGRLAAVEIYFVAQLDEATVLSSSPFHPQTHWRRPRRAFLTAPAVRPGDEVAIQVSSVVKDGQPTVMVELDRAA